MERTHNPQYSEAVGQAAENYDKLQEVLRQLRELEQQQRATMKKRLHTQNPKKLAELSEEIGRLNRQILFFDAEKENLAAKVKGLMDEHKKGDELLEQTDPKWVS